MHRYRPSLVLIALAVAALILPVAPAAAEPPLLAQDRFGAFAEARGFPERRAELHARLRAASEWPADAVPGRLLVTLADGAVEAAARPGLLSAGAVTGGLRLEPLAGRVLRAEVPAGGEAVAAAALRAVQGVAAVEPVRRLDRLAVPDDAAYPKQWAHRLTDMEAAWDVTTGSADITVAVIDDGVNATHPDLSDNVVEQVNAAGGTIEPTGVGVDNDPCAEGHGTQVAGVIGATGDNGLDVAGVNWEVSLLDIRVFSPESDCQATSDDLVISAIDYATNRPDGPVDVINLSLGGPSDACPTAYQAVVEEARAAGIVVVASSGNHEEDLPGVPSTPASCNGVISVGAVGPNADQAYYSTTNEYVDLAAPGGDFSVDGLNGGVLSTSRDGRTQPTQGTSFSSPYVAGLAALVRSVATDLTPDDVEAILEATATDAGPGGRDAAYGWGLVNGAAAVTLAADGAIPALEPDPEFAVGGGEQPPSETPPVDPLVFRLSAGGGSTEPVTQAVAVSQAVIPDDGAAYAVLARRDDFADALAGSALAFGIGPLLFTASSGPLVPETRAELQRTLPAGGTVYLLGGRAALPETLEGELSALGYEPVRIAGQTREETAALIGEEIRTVLPDLGFPNLPIALLATRQNWPDAVGAGSLASYFGIPILLTPRDLLHPATADALSRWQPELLYAVGGEAAITQAVLDQATAAGGSDLALRLAGPARDATMVAVSAEFEAVIREVFDSAPAYAVAVNVRREPDAWAHVLSATTLIGAFTGVFVPVEGEDGTVLTDVASDYALALYIDGILAGEPDLLADEAGAQLEALLRGDDG